MTRAAVLAGLGGYLPERIVTNDDLAAVLDTTDQWIRTRTGIAERRVAAAGEATSDLAVHAGRRALDSAGTHHVDAVVLATSTPDHPCPATAPAVASRLGLTGVAAFDVGAVCSGFVYALATCSGLVAAGIADTVLVIGADTFSTILDPTDRTTRAIFGDGAGAAVLRAGDPAEPGALGAFDLGSDGTRFDSIIQPAGGSRQRATGRATEEMGAYFTMEGRPVFMNAVLRMASSTRSVVKDAGWETADVDRLVAHQANARILRALTEELGMDGDGTAVSNIENVGNTVAASIPLALVDAHRSGGLRPGHRVVLTGFGGGQSWGSAALTWPALAA